MSLLKRTNIIHKPFIILASLCSDFLWKCVNFEIWLVCSLSWQCWHLGNTISYGQAKRMYYVQCTQRLILFLYLTMQCRKLVFGVIHCFSRYGVLLTADSHHVYSSQIKNEKMNEYSDWKRYWKRKCMDTLDTSYLSSTTLHSIQCDKGYGKKLNEYTITSQNKISHKFVPQQ